LGGENGVLVLSIRDRGGAKVVKELPCN
jgi:hypothetical protein